MATEKRKIMYHGTTQAEAAKIAKTGLVPQIGKVSKLNKRNKPAVWTVANEMQARRYGSDRTGGKHNYAVVQFSVPWEHYKQHFRKDRKDPSSLQSSLPLEAKHISEIRTMKHVQRDPKDFISRPFLRRTLDEVVHTRKFQSGQDDAVLGFTSGLPGGHAGHGF